MDALESGSSDARPRFASDIDPLEPSPRVRELYSKGERINAIRTYMDETGVGLREAKERVEALGE